MIEVEIEDPAWNDAVADAPAVATQAAEAALDWVEPKSNSVHPGEGRGDRVRSAPVPSAIHPAAEAQLTILLTSDADVRELNAQFRGKDAATNVLSFPAAPSARPHLGDIALAYGVCTAEAQAQAKPLRDHLIHLVVHGVLHLLGYDHGADAQAEAMEGIERDVLKGLGVSDPYVSRDADVEL